jgi:thiamine biosynthesis lipoprotein
VLRDLDRLGYRGATIDTANAEVAADPACERIVEHHGRRGRSIGRPIDLGGIGKGLALRWATGALEQAGATHLLLEAGGDLVARGYDPEGQAWRIGIEDPAGGDEPLAVIGVRDGAVATSSTRVNRWTVDGRVVHHLLDPATGEPATGGLAAVTVAGPDPAWAEVWSKALLIGGRHAVARLARARGLAAWWVSEDGALEMTAAARVMTMWVAAEVARVP